MNNRVDCPVGTNLVYILTGTDRPRKYWNDLKAKLRKEGSELSDKIGQFKLIAEDVKLRKTNVADTEQLFRNKTKEQNNY